MVQRQQLRDDMPIVTVGRGPYLAVRSMTGGQVHFSWPLGDMDVAVPAMGEAILSSRWREVPSFVQAEAKGLIACREVSNPIAPAVPEVPEEFLSEADLNLVAETMVKTPQWQAHFDEILEMESRSGTPISTEYMKTQWLRFLRQVMWREQNQRFQPRPEVIEKVERRIAQLSTA